MPRIVADVDADLKRWFQWQALCRETTMQELIAEALAEYKDRVGGDAPSIRKVK